MICMIALSMIALLLGGPLWATDPPGPAVPAATAADWHANAPAAATAADHQAKETAATAPTTTSFWSDVAGWSMGALGVLVLLGKIGGAANPLGGLVAAVAGGIYDLVVPKHVRDGEEKRDKLAESLWSVAHVIEQMPNDGTIGDLKTKFTSKLPSALRDHLTELSKVLKAEGVRPALELSEATPLQVATAGPAQG